MRRLLLATVILCLSGCDLARDDLNNKSQHETDEVIALVNATVIDGTGAASQTGLTVIIEHGRIADLGPSGTVIFPDTARVFDATGKFLIPGLIDTHVHMATDPSSADSRDVVEAKLAQALDRGITSVRDMAGDTRALASLKRDALLFDIHSPDIYYSALMAGPLFFSDPRTHSSAAGLTAGETPWMRAVTADTDLLYAIAEAKGTGATGIKMYANLGPDAVDRITGEAHQQGMMVWSHGALGPAGPKDAVASGVDVLSHISHFRWVAEDNVATMRRSRAQKNAELAFWDLPVSDVRIQDFLETLALAGTMLDPTLSVYTVDPDRPVTAATRSWAIEMTKAAHQVGILIATGTDVDSEIATLEEIDIMVLEVGMTPLEAITAATLNGARVIGIESETGSIEVGKSADLVLLDKDPTDDIAHLKEITMVFKNGRIVVQR